MAIERQHLLRTILRVRLTDSRAATLLEDLYQEVQAYRLDAQKAKQESENVHAARVADRRHQLAIDLMTEEELIEHEHLISTLNAEINVLDTKITERDQTIAAKDAEIEALKRRITQAEGRDAVEAFLMSLPNPVFDILKPELIGDYHVDVLTYNEDEDDVTQKVPIEWTTIQQILRDAFQYLAPKVELGE